MKSQVATTMSINESDQALSSGRLISNAPHSYTMLREKYAQLSNDYEHLQNAYKVLERKNDTEERHFIAEMEKLREAKNAAIANFQSYTVESEQRIKQIKEQLDEQYRNNFELLKFEVEKFKLENEQLEEQRIQLQRQIVEQNAELRKIKRENEEREIQIRNTYEEQINKLIDDLLIVHRKSVEDGTNQAEVDILRERYRSLNERYHQLHEDSERRQYENDSKIQRLETEILEHTLRGTRSAIHLQQLSMEVEHYRKSMEFANAEREHFKSEIKRLQKEKLTSDGESMARENSLTDQLFNQSLLIDKKLNQIDETIAQKDQLIEDLRNKLNDAEIQLKRCNESISDALKTKEELLIELNSLRNESHKKEDETHLSIEKLKWERDRALQHLADIRKSKGSGDTNMIEEIKKLEITIRNRDVEIRKVKEHYRRLLTKMKSSLLRAEKQIALLNGKFDANDIKALDEIMERHMTYDHGDIDL